MSNQAQGLVRGLELKAPCKPVLMAYAAYADELGYCWAGIDTIAFDTGYGPTTVKDARRELIRAGWMATKRRFGTSSIVRLNLERMTGEQVDRGEARMVHPELEFETEPAQDTAGEAVREIRRSSTVGRVAAVRVSAGRTQSAASRLTVAGEIGVKQPRGGCVNSRVAAEYSAATRPRSISDSSVDPSVDAPPPDPAAEPQSTPRRGRHRRAEPAPERTNEENPPPEMRAENVAPTLLALNLVAGLDFGAHRRPNRTQARALAIRVDAAIRDGLSVTEVRRHAQATVNAAKPPARKGNAVRYLMTGLAAEHLPVPHVPAGDLRGNGHAAASAPESGTLPAGADSEGRRAALAAVRALPSKPLSSGLPTARSTARRVARGTLRPRITGSSGSDAAAADRAAAAAAGERGPGTGSEAGTRTAGGARGD